jgi:hypothetical protein
LLSASTIAVSKASPNLDVAGRSDSGSSAVARMNRIQFPAGSTRLNPVSAPAFFRGRGRVMGANPVRQADKGSTPPA